MDLYKKIIPKKMRFTILRILKFIPDKQMIKIQYFIKLKRKLNLKDPKRYTEKIQWYKLYYRNDYMPICVDKYRVREYIKSKRLDHILVRLYATYNTADEINLNDLPDKFILKTTNGSGTNFICKDKFQVDEEQLRMLVSNFLKQSSASAGREWAYSHVKPKIIVEQLLEDTTTLDDSINDYKILCFNGKPEYVILDVDRFTHHKRNIYDINWNNLCISSDCPCSDIEYTKPETLNEMLRIAEILCKDFPSVRVDLYSIKGKVYFGELTFFPWSGYVKFSPNKFDYELGNKFILPKKIKEV